MTDTSPAVAAHLDQVVDGLVNHTGGSIRRHELRALVYQCYDELAANAKVTTFLPVLTGKLALNRLKEQGALDGSRLAGSPQIVIVDEHNATRSQTAAALVRFYAPGRFQVTSAGVHPSGTVSPLVIELLGEAGMDLTDLPKPTTPEMLSTADHVIAIGGIELDESLVAGSLVRWGAPCPDPTDQPGAEAILAEIDANVRAFLTEVDPDHRLHSPLLSGGSSADASSA